MINLLFITKDRSMKLERSTSYLIEELKKKCQLIVWTEGGDLSGIVSQIRFKPDFILLNDFHPDYCPTITGIKECPIPTGILMHDLQYKKGRRKRFIKQENIGYIFSNYREAFHRWFPEFSDRFIWFPHHVPIDLFKDYKTDRDINWLMMGALHRQLYPLRRTILHRMGRKPGFVYHGHPGYRTVSESERRFFVGEKYARELSRAKMFITTDSVYQFPVLKYFEAAACGTLVLGTASKELADLGFIDGKTFVAINEHNFTEKAAYYLEHEAERLAIARNGFDMVRARHSTEKRAQELIVHIHDILRNRC